MTPAAIAEAVARALSALHQRKLAEQEKGTAK